MPSSRYLASVDIKRGHPCSSPGSHGQRPRGFGGLCAPIMTASSTDIACLKTSQLLTRAAGHDSLPGTYAMLPASQCFHLDYTCLDAAHDATAIDQRPMADINSGRRTDTASSGIAPRRKQTFPVISWTPAPSPTPIPRTISGSTHFSMSCGPLSLFTSMLG